MIKAEFGMIDAFDERKDYSGYHPERYHCLAIDDDIYVNDWWEALSCIDTLHVYDKGSLHPQKALARWGITVIPPSSLPALLEIVIADKRYHGDKRLVALADLIRQAIDQKKYMIHYGV